VIGVDSIGGDFIQGFANSGNDVKIRQLMGIQGNLGYSAYVQDENGAWLWNPTILEEEPTTEENEDGSKTITYKLKEGLKWSDGEPVTSDDYIWPTLMLSSSSYNLVTGSTEIGADSVKGYEAYRSGETNEFEGVKKIDDTTFQFVIDASFLPYYEEEALKG